MNRIRYLSATILALFAVFLLISCGGGGQSNREGEQLKSADSAEMANHPEEKYISLFALPATWLTVRGFLPCILRSLKQIWF